MGVPDDTGYQVIMESKQNTTVSATMMSSFRLKRLFEYEVFLDEFVDS